ncbi:MAG: TRAP transporter large permease [Peptococcaceae bacterium]
MPIEVLIWIVLFACLLLGVPIFVSLGVSAFAVLLMTDIPLSIIPLDLYKMAELFPLLAIPSFIFAGALMERSDMANQIVETMQAMVGKVRGGLGIVTILGCMFFAALIGSGPATAAAMGTLMIPAMVRQGYGKDYAAGICATGGTIGILIPPSNPMIVYGVIGNVSVTGLFMAGFIPGFFVGGMLILTAYLIARKKGYQGSAKSYTSGEILKIIWKNKWSLGAPVVILGGIYGGIFTPVEASVVAVLYSALVGFFATKKLRDFNLLWGSFINAAETSGMVLMVVGVTQLFARILTMYQVPQNLAKWVMSISTNPQAILLMILGFLFLLGMFMEELATTAVLAPILVPLARQVGIDPLHLGILMVMSNEVAMLTPPLGVNLFVAMSVGKLSLEETAKAVFPFLITLIIATIIVVFFPEIVLFLPKLLLGYKG